MRNIFSKNKGGSELTIRIAKKEDREILVRLFLNYLKFLDQFEHDMLPTEGNAKMMVDQIFLPAAERGEPVLLAIDKGKVVGALFWTVQHLAYDCRWKTAVGYGSYLEKEYRSQGLVQLLWKKGKEILKSLGVQKLMGNILLKNHAALKAVERLQGVPYARLDVVDIQ